MITRNATTGLLEATLVNSDTKSIDFNTVNAGGPGSLIYITANEISNITLQTSADGTTWHDVMYLNGGIGYDTFPINAIKLLRYIRLVSVGSTTVKVRIGVR